METKRKLELMGQVVTVSQEYERQIVGDKRYWEAVDVEPRAGWITGFRTLQNGEVEQYDFGGPSCLDVAETVPCILVAYWPTYDPVQVPLNAYKLGGEPHYTVCYDLEWLRDLMREEMKDWPRDEQGRWIEREPGTHKEGQ